MAITPNVISPDQLDQFIKKATIRLEEKIRELEEVKGGLEERVEKRTAEIEKRVKEIEKSRLALMNMLEDFEIARKKAVEEGEKTKAIVTNFIDGLIVLDKKDNFLLINPRAEKFFGIMADQMINKPILKGTEFPPLKPLINLLIKKGEKIYREEISSVEDLILEVTTAPLTIEKEKIGTLVILHDVTREKAIERLKSEFVSIAAHQLRTPLSAIKWSLSFLQEGKTNKKEKEDLFNKVYVSNERMIKLINALLNVTRIEEGRYLYSLGLEDIEDIVKGVIKPIQDEAGRKNIQFTLSFSKKIPKIKVDKEKLSLAIQNLAENAVHYTKPGGEVIILVKYHKDREELLFKIKDTGVGIPKKQQKRVFSRFFRGENVMKMETEGSGLGLFITRNIIEAHRGRIWFESKEGKGSSFYFTLPV